MAAKRSATTDLNHDNWDKEDEPEEEADCERVAIASPDVLQNRVIKKARRTIERAGDDDTKSPFSGFSGFGRTPATPMWNKLSSNANPEVQNNNNKSTPTFSWNKFTSVTNKTDNETTSMDSKSESSNVQPPSFKKACSTEVEIDSKDSRYFHNIKRLNETFIEWIQSHMEKNPFYNFTPVCNDYKDHVLRLDRMFPFKGHSTSDITKASPFTLKDPTQVTLPSLLTDTSDNVKKSNFTFSLGQTRSSLNEKSSDSEEMDYGASFKSNTTNTSTFSSGIKIAQTATSSGSPLGPTISHSALKKFEKEKNSSAKDEPEKKNFNFNFNSSSGESKDNEKSAGINFKFGSSTDKPFSFSFAAAAPKPALESSNAEEDEYVPPKNDVPAIVEDDAIYSKRCKIFFKKDDEFKDKGIAMLYLKPCNEKTQLLIRNDTLVGTVLLNIVLSSTLPIQKQGKNNVLIICVPNPPIDPKNPDSKETVPILIRVKTNEDADELYEKLIKHQS